MSISVLLLCWCYVSVNIDIDIYCSVKNAGAGYQNNVNFENIKAQANLSK